MEQKAPETQKNSQVTNLDNLLPEQMEIDQQNPQIKLFLALFNENDDF